MAVVVFVTMIVVVGLVVTMFVVERVWVMRFG